MNNQEREAELKQCVGEFPNKAAMAKEIVCLRKHLIAAKKAHIHALYGTFVLHDVDEETAKIVNEKFGREL